MSRRQWLIYISLIVSGVPAMKAACVARNEVQSRIVKTPGVCGGDARVSGTRIPVWCLLSSRDAGCNDAVFLENYPSLSQDDLNAAWEYAKGHESELRQQIADNELSEAA